MRYAHVERVAGQFAPTISASLERANRFFDPWLTLDSGAMAVIMEELEQAVLRDSAPRQRKRKASDLENIRSIIAAVAANLGYVVAADLDPPAVAVLLARPAERQSRYDRQGFRQLPKVLERLHAGGFLTLSKSRKRGHASTIEPTPRFIELLPEVRKESFRQAGGEEPIVLSRPKTDPAADTRTAKWIDYTDTDDTRRYRQEITRINQTLAGAKLQYEGDASEIDPHRRKLHRVFNVPSWMPEGTVRFDLGGRLYGGWWQNLSENRRTLIKIDDEPIADLDFKSMFPQLAYILAGETMPPGDAYALPGYEGYRDGVKQAFNAMLFRRGPLTRLPRGSRELLPPDCTGEKIRVAIIDCHPGLRSVLETPVGFQLMFFESQILVAVLLRLIGLGITALPMHDGLMVAKSKADTAANVMGDISEELTGHRLPVVEKAPRTQ